MKRMQVVDGEQQYFDDCACCGMEFRRGPHVYRGDNVPGWNVSLCHTCKPPFRVGWEVSPTPRLMAALKANGVSVHPNRNGMLTPPD